MRHGVDRKGGASKKILIIIIGAGICWAILVAGGLGVLIYFGEVAVPTAATSAVLDDVEFMVSAYIKANQGQFPTCEDDLIGQGFLGKRKVGEEYEYYRGPSCFGVDFPPENGRWLPLDLFKLAYGADATDLELVNGKLYDKSSGKEVLLITGPYKENLKRTPTCYESVSLQWYRLMLEYR